MRQEFTNRKAVAESISLRTALLLMFLFRLSAPIYAHPVPYSYLDLRMGQSQGQLEGSLVAHVTYLSRELNVTPAESLLKNCQNISVRHGLRESFWGAQSWPNPA